MKFRLSTLIISIFTLVLWWLLYSSTLESQLNRKQAFKDIISNQVKLVYNGIGGPSTEQAVMSHKYGFKYYNLGCVVYHDKGIEEYKAIIDEYLKMRNGANWEGKYYRELEALYKLQDSIYKNQEQNQ